MLPHVLTLVARGQQRGFIDHIGQLGGRHAARLAGQHVEVDVRVKPHACRMQSQD